jgi:hypothetical protein
MKCNMDHVMGWLDTGFVCKLVAYGARCEGNVINKFCPKSFSD